MSETGIDSQNNTQSNTQDSTNSGNAENSYAENSNAANFAGFTGYVAQLKQSMKRQYDRGVNKDLSQQNWQDLLKRNVTWVLKQGYKDALSHLQSMTFAPQGVSAEKDDSPLSVQALKPLDGLIDELMQYALQKHRTSCALSNFPDEHKPSQDYIADVLQQADKDWQEFVWQVKAAVLR